MYIYIYIFKGLTPVRLPPLRFTVVLTQIDCIVSQVRAQAFVSSHPLYLSTEPTGASVACARLRISLFESQHRPKMQNFLVANSDKSRYAF